MAELIQAAPACLRQSALVRQRTVDQPRRRRAIVHSFVQLSADQIPELAQTANVKVVAYEAENGVKLVGELQFELAIGARRPGRSVAFSGISDRDGAEMQVLSFGATSGFEATIGENFQEHPPDGRIVDAPFQIEDRSDVEFAQTTRAA